MHEANEIKQVRERLNVYIYALFRKNVTYQHLTAPVVRSSLVPKTRCMSRTL